MAPGRQGCEPPCPGDHNPSSDSKAFTPSPCPGTPRGYVPQPENVGGPGVAPFCAALPRCCLQRKPGFTTGQALPFRLLLTGKPVPVLSWSTGLGQAPWGQHLTVPAAPRAAPACWDGGLEVIPGPTKCLVCRTRSLGTLSHPQSCAHPAGKWPWGCLKQKL